MQLSNVKGLVLRSARGCSDHGFPKVETHRTKFLLSVLGVGPVVVCSDVDSYLSQVLLLLSSISTSSIVINLIGLFYMTSNASGKNEESLWYDNTASGFFKNVN